MYYYSDYINSCFFSSLLVFLFLDQCVKFYTYFRFANRRNSVLPMLRRRNQCCPMFKCDEYNFMIYTMNYTNYIDKFEFFCWFQCLIQTFFSLRRKSHSKITITISNSNRYQRHLNGQRRIGQTQKRKFPIPKKNWQPLL